ncbi:MAG: diguanylate cyclase [bacterium]
MALFALGYFASAEIGHLLSIHGDELGQSFATLWPPSGLYVAALLLAERRHWPALALVALLANSGSDVLVHAQTPRLSLAFWCANTVEAAVGASLVRRFFGAPFIEWGVRHVLGFAALSVGLGAAAAALLGATALVRTLGGDLGTAFAVWWSSAAIGQLVVAPAVLAFHSRVQKLATTTIPPLRVVEGCVLAVVLALLAELVFGQQSRPIAFAVFPVMMLAALRFEIAGVAFSTTILASICIVNTGAGRGPFAAATASIPERVVLAQSLLSLAAFSSLVLAAAVRERRRAEAASRADEARYRDLFENMRELVQIVRRDGSLVQVNHAWQRVLGYGDAELGRLDVFDVIHPEDRDHCAKLLERVLAGEDVGRIQARFVAKDGRVVEVDGTSRRHLHGDLEALSQAVFRDVTEERARSRELERAQQDLERANHELRRLAATDALTGLNNRGAFEEHLPREINRAFRYATALSLVILDVDHFKLFNDRFGHSAGDDVLRTVARIVRATARATDFVARYGGEELVAILPHTDEVGALAQAERFREAVAGWAWTLRPITVSVGVATLATDPMEPGLLVALADQALYRAKQAGRNRVESAGRASQLASPFNAATPDRP